MVSFPPDYSIRIPAPDIAALEQLAQFSTPDGVLCVYWSRDTHQAILEFNDKYFIQNDGYITDSVAEILGIKESLIMVGNLTVGNLFDSSSLSPADPEIARSIYDCKWSDYTCDYMFMQADLDYPYDD